MTQISTFLKSDSQKGSKTDRACEWRGMALLIETPINLTAIALSHFQACEAGRVDIMTELIDNGARLSMVNRKGHTCAWLATVRNKPQVLQKALGKPQFYPW